MYKKTMREALKEARAYRDPIDEGITGNIQKAITIAKKMGGNMTGAIKEIEKIAKGLSDDPSVRAALKTANESLGEDKENSQYMIDYLKKRVLTEPDPEKKKKLLKKIEYYKKQMSEDAPANEELDEAKDLMLTYGKPGGDAKVYYTDFMQDLQNKASEFRKKGFVIGKMGKTMPMSQLPKTMPMKGMDIKEEELISERRYMVTDYYFADRGQVGLTVVVDAANEDQAEKKALDKIEKLRDSPLARRKGVDDPTDMGMDVEITNKPLNYTDIEKDTRS